MLTSTVRSSTQLRTCTTYPCLQSWHNLNINDLRVLWHLHYHSSDWFREQHIAPSFLAELAIMCIPDQTLLGLGLCNNALIINFHELNEENNKYQPSVVGTIWCGTSTGSDDNVQFQCSISVGQWVYAVFGYVCIVCRDIVVSEYYNSVGIEMFHPIGGSHTDIDDWM